MTDLAGKELNIGDVVVTNAGYNSRLAFGVVRRVNHSLHLYNLNDYGPIAARKDMKIKEDKWHSPWYCYSGTSCVKIPKDTLPEDLRTVYNVIMQILNKNVATASNT